MDDEDADRRRNPVSSTKPESVRSGRTIEQVPMQHGQGDDTPSSRSVLNTLWLVLGIVFAGIVFGVLTYIGTKWRP